MLRLAGLEMPLRWEHPRYFPRLPKPPIQFVHGKVKISLTKEFERAANIGVHIRSAGPDLVFRPPDARQRGISLSAEIDQYVVPGGESTYLFDITYRWKFVQPLQTRSVLEFFVYELVPKQGWLRSSVERSPLTGFIRIEIPLLDDEEIRRLKSEPSDATEQKQSATGIKLDIDFELLDFDDLTEKARLMLMDLENRLRRLVHDNSPAIPDDIKRDWNSARHREFAPWRRPSECEPISYSNFEHLRLIIVQNENWSKLFSKYFRRPNGIIARLGELDSIRDTLAHDRHISEFDYDALRVLYKQLLTCMDSAGPRD